MTDQRKLLELRKQIDLVDAQRKATEISILLFNELQDVEMLIKVGQMLGLAVASNSVPIIEVYTLEIRNIAKDAGIVLPI